MVYFLPMISLDDVRWSNMTGGYKSPFDPRPLLKKLATDSDTTEVWHELWEELHHQGDVGEASFAAAPFLVRSYRERGLLDWNIYAFRDRLRMTTSRQLRNERRSVLRKYWRPKPRKMFAPS
jgi:hypothetical protein